jgi:hypothetical protein
MQSLILARVNNKQTILGYERTQISSTLLEWHIHDEKDLKSSRIFTIIQY